MDKCCHSINSGPFLNGTFPWIALFPYFSLSILICILSIYILYYLHVVSSIVITTMMIYFYEPECFFISRGNAATFVSLSYYNCGKYFCKKKKKQKINPQDKSAYGIAPGRYKPKLFVYLESKKLKNYYKLSYRNVLSSIYIDIRHT